MRAHTNGLPKNRWASFTKIFSFHILLEYFLRKSAQYQKYIHLSADLILLSFSLILAGYITHGSAWMLSKKFMCGVGFLNIIWLFAAYNKELYKDLLINDTVIIMRQTFKIWWFFSILTCFLFIIIMGDAITAKHFYPLFGLSVGIFGLLLLFNRLVFLSVRKKFKDSIKQKKNIILIGSNTYSQLFKDYVDQGYGNFNIVGCFQDSSIRMIDDKTLYSGNAQQSIDCINDMVLDEVYCTLSSFNKDGMQKLLQQADKNMVRVKFIPDFYELFDRPMSMDHVGKIPVISVREEPLLRDRNIITKRLFDIVFSSLVILFILSWCIPLLILLIKLDSKGPVFFKQKRSGLNNKDFNCYKFRSMTVNKNADAKQASKNDARITKVGAILRKTSIDELPQFFNVLIGNMSIVGPRPHMLLQTKEFGTKVDTYMIRHFVKPGITGWAQVNGYRGETKGLEKLKKRIDHDVWYLENWSFLLDMKIIFLTIWNIVKGEENAY